MKTVLGEAGESRWPWPNGDELRHGWDVFDIGSGDYPQLEIQRCDEPEGYDYPAFEDDDRAVVYVMDRACRAACPEARKAIREIVASWKGD